MPRYAYTTYMRSHCSRLPDALQEERWTGGRAPTSDATDRTSRYWQASIWVPPSEQPERWETAIPLVDISWHTWTTSTRNMHTEPRDAVPLWVIAADQGVFRAGHLPHPINSKKPASDFVDPNSSAHFYFSADGLSAGNEAPWLVQHTQANHCERGRKHRVDDELQASRADVQG